MSAFLCISGLILLFCYFACVRLSFRITCNSQGTGMDFAMQAFTRLSFTRKHLIYRYENKDFEIIPVLDRVAAFTKGLKKRSKYHDMKAYLIRLGFYDYRSFLKVCLKYIRIEELDWKSQLGIQDVMYTGISTGIIWALKGVIIGLVSAGRQLKKLHLEVHPIYEQETFMTDLHCIIKMRIVHIIFIAAYMLLKIVRGYINGYRPGKTKPSHRGAYENGYAKY